MLTQFYKDMQAWVAAGCPPHKAFQKRTGLCDNLVQWLHQQEKLDVSLFTQMRNQFREAGKNIYFPFNDTSFNENTSYRVEAEAGLCYTNKQRLDWIKHHATTRLSARKRHELRPVK